MRALARLTMVGVVTGASACSGAPADDEAATAQPRLAWSAPWGTAGDDFARSVVVDEAGAVYAAGYTDGVFEGAESAGAFDAFLTRWAADGSQVWSRQWGGDGPEFAQAVVLGADGQAFVAGYSPSSIDEQVVAGGHDVFLTLHDADGNYVWTKQWGTDADDYVYAAARTGSGVAIVGYTRGAFDGFENAGGADVFVSVCDASGTPLWNRQFGTSATDYAQAVHVDAEGYVLVAGYSAGKLGEDPDPGAEDAFLLKLSADGELLWLRQWGSETTDYALSVSSDAAGNAYVAGYTYGSVGDQAAIGGEDGYLTKVSPEGELVWTRQFGTVSRDSARFVSVDSRGEVLVGGDTEGSFGEGLAGGGRDSFVARFDEDGVPSFKAQWGNAAGEFSLSADTAGGALYVAGYIEPGNASRDALLTRWSLW